MVKNIVVLSDGTAQEGGIGSPSNVYKLFNMLEDRTKEQVVFYDRGVGTGSRTGRGMVIGRGLGRNVRDCYEFIFENYEAGDHVYLFGFSRGAATVRSLSGFVHLFGILPKSRPELIGQAYDIYKSGSSNREERADAFVKRHHTMWCRIKFLGVWDTVAALGFPIKWLDVLLDIYWPHRFHSLKLSEGVQHARQALAIDDERKSFYPELWDKEVTAHQTMKQVWFCGMHSDVGGSKPLAHIPLIWMLEEARQHGLRLFAGHDVQLLADADAKMGDTSNGIWALLPSGPRSWNAKKSGELVVHESVNLRTRDRHNSPAAPYAPWLKGEPQKEEPWPENERGSVRLT